MRRSVQCYTPVKNPLGSRSAQSGVRSVITGALLIESCVARLQRYGEPLERAASAHETEMSVSSEREGSNDCCRTRSRHCFRGNRTSNVPGQYASLLAPAPARLTTRAHPGVGTRAEIRRQAREAAHCRRKSTLDRTTDPTTLRLARLKSLSFFTPASCKATARRRVRCSSKRSASHACSSI